MSGLQAIAGGFPFGGDSIAAKRGFHTYNHDYRDKKEETKMPNRRRRSTADEATAANAEKGTVELASKFVTDRTFIVCCTQANVKPTVRQARKFRHGEGAAFAQLAHLVREAD